MLYPSAHQQSVKILHLLKVELILPSEATHLAVTLSKNVTRILQSSMPKLVSVFLSFLSTIFRLKDITEIAVKIKGGAKYVNHGLVISLLWEVVALLKGLLHDLKLIVKAEILLGVSLKELARLVAELVIVCIFSFRKFLAFLKLK